MGRTAVVLGLGACAFLALCAPDASADGVVRDGLGPISLGRGGTNIAHADNGVVLLDNPAGIVGIAGQRLEDVSMDVLLTDLHYSDPQNDTDAVVRPFPLPQVSFITKADDGRWAYGIGAFAPAGFGAEYAMQGPPAIPGVHRYKSLGALGKILPAVAYRVDDRLSIGATLGVAVSHIELEGPYFVQEGTLSGTPTVMDLQATGAALAWSVGAQYHLSDWTTLGVAYQNETRFDLDGNASVTIAGLGESDFDAKMDVAWPQSLGIGIKHCFCAHRRFSADVIWFDWSGAFDEVRLRLTDPSNPLFEALIGPTVRDRFPLNWDDSISVRVGYELFPTPCSVVRVGYAYHPNQIPESTLTPFIPAILEHAISVGWGRSFHEWRFDAAYQYSFGQDRSVETSGFVGGDFDNSRVEAQAHWISLGAVRRF